MGGAFGRLTRADMTPLLALAKKNRRLEIADLPPVEAKASCAPEAKVFFTPGPWLCCMANL